jgi:hypothetical protein
MTPKNVKRKRARAQRQRTERRQMRGAVRTATAAIHKDHAWTPERHAGLDAAFEAVASYDR